jgi:hypothetical protein
MGGTISPFKADEAQHLEFISASVAVAISKFQKASKST